MYVCGMTVYDLCHLGHARVMVVFDIVKRWLIQSGYSVTYVRNITDVDDKIIRRAEEQGISFQSLTARYIDEMHKDSRKLGVLDPDFEPKASENINTMIEMIQVLLKKGLAYHVPDGDVYFAVDKFKRYGRLSGKSLQNLEAGIRVALDKNKKNALDFVLWKKAKLGEPQWEAPWGGGRPGWHIECSAMSKNLLGNRFDIHGGGEDLQFPHHENEIAQSEGANESHFVNYWMHNGFVNVDNEKMSKSLGNFFTVRDLLEKYDPEVVRFFMIRSHYRKPLHYSDSDMDDARQSLARLYSAIRNVEVKLPVDWKCDFAMRFKSAMDDDFNTAEAVAVLFQLTTKVNLTKSHFLRNQLRGLANILGLLVQDADVFFHGKDSSRKITVALIEEKIKERNNARNDRNFKKADEIRQFLLSMDIELEDSKSGTKWRRR